MRGFPEIIGNQGLKIKIATYWGLFWAPPIYEIHFWGSCRASAPNPMHPYMSHVLDPWGGRGTQTSILKAMLQVVRFEGCLDHPALMKSPHADINTPNANIECVPYIYIYMYIYTYLSIYIHNYTYGLQWGMSNIRGEVFNNVSIKGFRV